MRNAKAYKSAFYQASDGGRFWAGKAVDRQISGPREVSDYWIQEFLLSDLLTTGPAGTKRLAVALRTAIRSAADITVRRELLSVADLVRGQDGRAISASQVMSQLGLSEAARSAFTAAFPRPDLTAEIFQFDREEFDKHAAYRAVELDTGVVIIAEDATFNDVVITQVLRAAENRVRYVAEGNVVDERLRRTK